MSLPTCFPTQRRLRLAPALCLFLGLLSGCGGGLYLSIGDGWGDDGPPQVQMSATPQQARVGATVRLQAVASDASGVDFVSFYRIDASNNAVLLGTDGLPPYELDVVVPPDAADRWRLFAWAEDPYGNGTRSASVDVTVWP